MSRLTSLLLALTAGVPCLHAQADSVGLPPTVADSASLVAEHRWHLGAGVVFPFIRAQEGGAILTSIGLSATAAVTPNRLAPDFGVVIAPVGLFFGTVLANVRANVALPIATGSASRLVPSAGLSVLGAAGLGGMGGVVGYNTTLAYHAFARARGESAARLGARIALGRHHVGGVEGGGYWLFEVALIRR